MNKQLCQAFQHNCSFIAQATPFTSNHHQVNLRNQILQGIGSPSSRVKQGRHCRVWKFSRHAVHGIRATPLAFPRAPPWAVARAKPNLSKALYFVDMT